MRIASASLAVAAALILSACSYLPDIGPGELVGVKITDTRDYIEILPLTTQRDTGFIFYPGALVDPHAYQTLWARVARQGYPVLIVKFGANLAITDGLKGIRVLDSYEGPSRWIISGHSLGGTMAATTVKQNPGRFAAIVFLASYPSDADSLADWNGIALSVSAENDGLATREKIQSRYGLLPANAVQWNAAGDSFAAAAPLSLYHEIAGGVHAFFGSYGTQDGDGTPAIARATQQDETAAFILELCARMGW